MIYLFEKGKTHKEILVNNSFTNEYRLTIKSVQKILFFRINWRVHILILPNTAFLFETYNHLCMIDSYKYHMNTKEPINVSGK